MKRFKVVCIGYKELSKEKIKDLLKFEESYLGNKRKVCIHKDAYRRLPTEIGGLGLCKNLKKK